MRIGNETLPLLGTERENRFAVTGRSRAGSNQPRLVERHETGLASSASLC